MIQTEFLTAVAGVYAEVFASDLMRYVLGAGGVFAVVNLALARRLRARKIRAEAPPEGQIRREILASLRTVAIFALTGTMIVLSAEAGLLPIYREVAEYGWVYFALSTGGLIVAHDAWFYWTHRLLHMGALFRLYHRLHHRSRLPTPFTSYCFDSGEAVVNALFLPLMLVVLPMHPAGIVIFVTHMILRNTIGHSGYELFPADGRGRPLLGWLTTVTHHDLHHADGRYNLGLYFTWWDRLMGTEHPGYLEAFARVGRPLRPAAVKAGVLTLAILLGLWAGEGRAAGELSNELSGSYASPGLGVVVRFEPCADDPALTCGRFLWAWDPEEMSHARAGDIIVTGLRREAGGWRGRLTDPETGRSYRGAITREGPEVLLLRGCAGPFCTTQRWHSLRSLRRALARLE